MQGVDTAAGLIQQVIQALRIPARLWGLRRLAVHPHLRVTIGPAGGWGQLGPDLDVVAAVGLAGQDHALNLHGEELVVRCMRPALKEGQGRRSTGRCTVILGREGDGRVSLPGSQPGRQWKKPHSAALMSTGIPPYATFAPMHHSSEGHRAQPFWWASFDPDRGVRYAIPSGGHLARLTTTRQPRVQQRVGRAGDHGGRRTSASFGDGRL